MQTVLSRDRVRAFRLGAWDVERLVQILGGDERITQVAVELSDGTTLRLSHAGEIPAVPNARGRRIVGLALESAPPAFLGTDEAPPRLALVQLRDRPWGPVSWYLSGDERAVRPLSGALEDWAASVTPWYGGIATASRVALALGGLGALGLLAVVATALYLLAGGAPFPAAAPSASWAAAARAAAVGALLVVAATAALGILRRDRLFPAALFLVGAGDERERGLARRRGWLLGAGSLAAVLAAAGSIVAGLGA